MSSGKRLGNDPLTRGALGTPSGGAALRHILDTAQAGTCREPAADNEETYRAVAGKFAQAMEQLSRLAASAGAWAWGAQCGQPCDGDTFLFMRLMASYRVTAHGEGVDAAAFLRDVHGQWPGCASPLSLGFEDILIPLGRAFNLARCLQAAQDVFAACSKDCPEQLTIAAGFAASGALKVSVLARRECFPAEGRVLDHGRGESLAGIARSGAASVIFSSSEQSAELAVLI